MRFHSCASPSNYATVAKIVIRRIDRQVIESGTRIRKRCSQIGLPKLATIWFLTLPFAQSRAVQVSVLNGG